TLAFSPDASKIVFTLNKGVLGIWDINTRVVSLKHSQSKRGHITATAFSPDGSYIISASQDYSLAIWDTTTGDIIKETLTGHLGIIFTVVFLPGGLQIASGSGDTTVRFWDIQPYIQAGTTDNDESDTITSIAVSPDGTRIVYGLESITNNLKICNTLPPDTQTVSLNGHRGPVTALSFGHSSAHILSGSQDKTLKLWNCEKGNVIQTFTGSNLKFEITALAFSSDDLYIVSAAGRTYRERGITVWDTVTGSILGGPFRAHKAKITSIAFSHDSQYVYSGSFDCSIKLWD
ncbi:WD40 repeat-like protein, partial [Artomyces pyxidatus]